ALPCAAEDSTARSPMACCFARCRPRRSSRCLGHPRSQAADAVAVLPAYVTFYDLRGGGIETSFNGDKQGLGLTKRTKKRFETQHMLMLLGSLAHNVVIWARSWLTSPETRMLWHLAYGA